ncbi:MAG: radical SAM/SPASM domain-containing protein [Candidatus Aureabacteria bacterium]|nr:radical SAM/SPASM domain-containing protein [Candidatus Auribacterota bacterium]
MDTAFLIITNRCTKRCSFCFYSTGYQTYPEREMGDPEMLTAIGKLAALGITNLIITGGEPLLRRELIPLIRSAGELGMTRLILTNGDLLDERIIGEFIACGLEGLSISVNSMHDARKIERCAALLQRSGRVRVTVTKVISRENFRDIGAIYRWAVSRGLGIIIQPAYLPEHSALFKTLSPHHLSRSELQELTPILGSWGNRQRVAAYVGFIFGLYKLGPDLKPAHCGMGTSALVLDSDGSVYPCFHRRDLPAGNILSDPPESIRNRLESMRKSLQAAPCYGEHCVSLFIGYPESGDKRSETSPEG